ncbi:MAG: CoB--CoM heterodisulfide reductase iron-sulfur subunit A family protein [Deltaproteobacteria bacterium]|nr:CoB--CoM heterodisulfide reductase iron-sulfur subunit A family protein [Deltaproteobacteria bacterium]MBW2069640.1 CoB--CoM heterodisulfide reductase iron-sulfur subunit A family protein [Deltaproteobacteria bacterium]
MAADRQQRSQVKVNDILVALCQNPTCRLSPGLLESITREGWRVWPCDSLCAPWGLQQLRRKCRIEKPAHLVVGVCQEVIRQGLIEQALGRLIGKRRLHLLELGGSDALCQDLPALIRALLQSKPARRPPLKHKRVLVVGGGVGGCQAALDIANSGIPVTLLESELSIGGLMAKLDKTFPTLDCSICILGPKLVEVANHPEIQLLTNAEVVSLAGRQGNFSVEVQLKPRYVDMAKCSGCGKCMEVCPVIVPSDWNVNMKPTKCIHISFEQAIPLRSAIDRRYCIECKLCEVACERQAIDFDDQGQQLLLRVGAIVLATGVDLFDPSRIGSYGYGTVPGVISNIEFERLVAATGPTAGRLLTPDGRQVRSLAFVQCVGSRNARYLPNCSGYCCTASIKEAMLAIEHVPDAEVSIFYNDIRTAGKGFEELYQRAVTAGIHFIKGLPAAVEMQHGRPSLVYDNMVGGSQQRLTVDLVVLAVGMEPRKDGLLWQLDEEPARDSYGFYQEKNPVLHPLESTVAGVYLLGTCRGPRDIGETVADASGVAAKVAAQFRLGQLKQRATKYKAN